MGLGLRCCVYALRDNFYFLRRHGAGSPPHGACEVIAFFGCAADISSADYSAAFERVSEPKLLADWTAQINGNAEIARDKHLWAGKALMILFMSELPWGSAVILYLRSRKPDWATVTI